MLGSGRTNKASALDQGQYQLLFDTVPQGVVFHDADGRVMTMNPAAERILGRPPEELTDDPSGTAEHGTIREDGSPFPGVEHPSIVSMRTGREVSDVVMGVYNPRERGYRWISITAVPLFRSGEDRPYQVYTLFQDVTQQKRADQALRDCELSSQIVEAVKAERKRLYDVLDTLPVMICLITPDYGIPFANRAFREKFGESHGRRCYDYCFGQPEPCDFCQSFKVLETGRPHHWEVRHPDGSVIDAYDFPFRDADGSPMVLEMDADVTEQKRAEEALRKSNAELQQFAYIASHDLQEPLRMVSSYLQLIERREGEKLDETSRRYIGFAVEGARRMKAMIDDILTYSQVESKGDIIEPVDMEKVLSVILRDLDLAISESGASVTHDPLPTMEADRGRMTLLMENLVGNAIKYRSEAAPQVHVSACRSDSEWVFSIEDNGIGIDPKYEDKLFKMFQRLHTREEYEGTGMGLAISKKIVERYGGRIWFESESGKGSTFYFSMPLALGRSERVPVRNKRG